MRVDRYMIYRGDERDERRDEGDEIYEREERERERGEGDRYIYGRDRWDIERRDRYDI